MCKYCYTSVAGHLVTSSPPPPLRPSPALFWEILLTKKVNYNIKKIEDLVKKTNPVKSRVF